MKTVFVVLVVAFLLVSVVSAVSDNANKDNSSGRGNNAGGVGEGESTKGNDTVNGKPENNKTGKVRALSENKTQGGGGPVQAIAAVNKSMYKGNSSNTSIQARLRVIEKLEQKISEEETKVKNDTNNNRDKTKEFKKQNLVRERVMSLLALRNMTQGQGIGQQVAEVARNFSNSINKTQKAEERINNRGWFTRVLIGGDAEAADEVEKEVQENRARISQLKELRKSTGGEIGQFIDEQLQGLEVEQNRLTGLANKEKKSKGIFGWLFK